MMKCIDPTWVIYLTLHSPRGCGDLFYLFEFLFDEMGRGYSYSTLNVFTPFPFQITHTTAHHNRFIPTNERDPQQHSLRDTSVDGKIGLSATPLVFGVSYGLLHSYIRNLY